MTYENEIIRSEAPADSWAEGYPIGNGRLAAMVLGGSARDRVALNHDRLWRRYWRFEPRKTGTDISAMRRLITAERWEDAYNLMKEKIGRQGNVLYVNPFVPVADLGLYPWHFGTDEVGAYRRGLDLDRGIVKVTYAAGSYKYRREYFVSRPAGVLVIHLRANQAGRTSGEISLCRVLDRECTVEGTAGLDELVLRGRFEEGVEFAAVARLVKRGGRFTSGLTEYIQPDGDERPKDLEGFTFGWRNQDHSAEPRGVSTCIDSADELMILIAIATDSESHDVVDFCHRRLDSVPLDYNRLREEHIQDHRALYRRVSLNLSEDIGSLDTQQLVDDARKTGKASAALIELLYKTGRYLAISAGRPADSTEPFKAPMNLQGVWNEDPRPAWDCDYHVDLNLEMCYWPLGMANLAEAGIALVDWAESLLPQARLAARDMYDVAGAFYSGVCDIANIGNNCDLGMLATGVSAWLAQTLWHVWEYRCDVVELRHRIYPIMREIGRFYEEFLIEDETGRLVPLPSGSPEITPVGRKVDTMMSRPSTFDLVLIRELFEHLIEAAKILCEDNERSSGRWPEMLRKIPMPTLDDEGKLLEWLDAEYEVTDAGHRHRSHLVSFCPGDRITAEDTPEYAEGIRMALEKRLSYGFNTSCSLTKVWDAQLFARLYDGERAILQLDMTATDHVLGNLLMCLCNWRDEADSLRWFGDRKVFQIEANIGIIVSIQELFLQDRRGLLRVLPALPKRLASGEVRGLRARGGFEVAVSWNDHRLTELKILSLRGGQCRVKLFAAAEKLLLRKIGGTDTLTPKDGVVKFDTEKGETYVLMQSD